MSRRQDSPQDTAVAKELSKTLVRHIAAHILN